MRRNKKKRKNPKARNRQHSATVNDYDLRRDLRKLDQGGLYENEVLQTQSHVENSRASKLKSDLLAAEDLTETKTLLSINDRFTDKLESLRKDVYTTNEKIGASSDSLRLELEDKIQNKTSKNLFYGAIAALVALATAFYYISYSGLLNKATTTYETTVENKQEIRVMKEKTQKTAEFIESQKEMNLNLKKQN